MLRLPSASFLLDGLAALSACGSESEDDPADAQSVCDIGSSLLVQIVDELERDSPLCRSVADCTIMEAGIECRGNQVRTCARTVHRASVALFDQDEANARFCASFKASRYGCIVHPSCVAAEPACEAGRCVSKPLAF
jgi:hypothetical protein